MPSSIAPITSHGYAAEHCRAKDPATCRVHGHGRTNDADAYLIAREQQEPVTAAAVRQRLTREFAGTLSSLESAVSASSPAYVAAGNLANRLGQFDERLQRAGDDLAAALQQARVTDTAVDAEFVRSHLAHNLNPVIGWLHSDLNQVLPTYGTHAVRDRVDALKTKLTVLSADLAAYYR